MRSPKIFLSIHIQHRVELDQVILIECGCLICKVLKSSYQYQSVRCHGWRRRSSNSLQVVEQVSKIYDMTIAQQKERQLKAEGLRNDMATSGSDGYLRFA